MCVVFASKSLVVGITSELTWCSIFGRCFNSRLPRHPRLWRFRVLEMAHSQEETVKGFGSRKRMRQEGEGASSGAAASSAQGSREAGQGMLGNVPSVVGQGDFQQPLMEAVLTGIRDLAVDVQEWKSAVYHSWEFQGDSAYVAKAMEFKEQ